MIRILYGVAFTGLLVFVVHCRAENVNTDAPQAKPDWIAPLSAASWTSHHDWLGNPAGEGQHAVATSSFARRRP